jgi:hypothetical protein
VSGGGVGAGEIVLVEMQIGGLHGQFSLGNGKANEHGIFSFTYKGRGGAGLPAGIDDGVYSLVAVSGSGAVVASTSITVGPAPAASAPQPQPGNALVVSPNVVCHGEFIHGMVSGFENGELAVVSMIVGGDIGDLILTHGTLGESGAKGWTFKARGSSGVSSLIAAGVYTVKVEGTSGGYATAPVEIRALVDGKCS